MWCGLTICLTTLLLPTGIFELITDHGHSIASMKSLVEREGLFIKELTNYKESLQWKIDQIDGFLKKVRAKRVISRKNTDEFVAHPLNSFSLIRRLHEDWTHFERYMLENVGLSNLENIKTNLDEAHYTYLDLKDVTNGISSIQRFHDLKSTDMASGFLMGRQYSANLSTLECLAMANLCLFAGETQLAIDWHKAALQQFDEIKDGQIFKEVFNLKLTDLYKNYTKALLTTGLRKSAIDLLQGVSDSDAELWMIQRLIQIDIKVDRVEPIYVKPKLWHHQKECLGLLSLPTNLTCHYESGRNAFLIIAPLKKEILSVDPQISIYHDVIYESEITRVKNISLSSLKGPLRYPKRDEYNLKFAKVHDDEKSALNQRIMDMTGEAIKEDKDFHIFNYGVGGFSLNHLDSLNAQDQKPGLGNRLTSILFFLSDVDKGGALVFSEKSLSVFPKKGSALVWRNLDNTLQPNSELIHMSCPVIVGSKWTLIKWLHAEPQVFARPCRKKYEEFIA